MTPPEAQEIIEKFHLSIKDLRPESIVQSTSELPYTSGRIKYAHFVYAEYFVKDDFYTQAKTNATVEEMRKSVGDKCNELMESYGLIDSLFREDFETVNAEYRKYIEGLRNHVITGFRLPNPFGEIEPVHEFYNFLGEAWFVNHHTDLFNDSPLGSFVYHELLKKNTKEQDVESLIEIANTSLTRSVLFPGRKSNKDSIFI